MKYILVLDESFINQADLTIKEDKIKDISNFKVKPVIRPTLIFDDGVSIYLTQGHINAMLKHEEMETIKEVIERMNNSIKELGL